MQTTKLLAQVLARARWPRRSRWPISALLVLTAGTVLFAVSLAVMEAATAAGRPVAVGAAPGSILGIWSTSCDNSRGMTVEFTPASGGTVAGRIKELGLAKRFGYRKGDEIIRLKPSPGGGWTGHLFWRNTAGVKRWQPMTMRFQDGKLRGSSASEHCYDEMSRIR